MSDALNVTVTHRIEIEPATIKALEGLVRAAAVTITGAIVAALRADAPQVVTAKSPPPPPPGPGTPDSFVCR